MQINSGVGRLLPFACIALNTSNYFYKKQSFLIEYCAGEATAPELMFLKISSDLEEDGIVH